MKRYRTPKARPGQLKAQWGKLPEEAPDLVFCWGNGISRCDGSMLHSFLDGKRYNPIRKIYENSFLDELQERGYDITTLKISVEKKTV
ncbi:MAG: hypothetical protein KDJ38_18505 [Gammaproteobacteria bacterium]|nr:hypothetical protein [Gammaproteobacteria bacterium]